MPTPHEIPPDRDYELALLAFCLRPSAGSVGPVQRLVHELPVTAVVTPDLGELWEAIRWLVTAGRDPTPAAVAQRLDANRWSFGRVTKIAETSLAESHPGAADARVIASGIADRLMELHRRREAQEAVYGAWLAVTAESLEAAAPYVERAAAAVLAAAPDGDIPSLGELAERAYLEAAQAVADRAAGKPLDLVGSGLQTLDEQTAGFDKGDLWVVGAYTGVGKTSAMIQIARNVAHTRADGRPRIVHIVSAEMAELQIGRKALAADARVRPASMRTGDLSGEEVTRLQDALGYLAALQVFVDGESRSVRQIRARARTVRARYGRLDLLMVDYLQLLESEEPSENRQIEVTRLSHSLKHLATELAIPVVALAQLGRASQSRARPELRDLRESGAIEQDADYVVFLHDPGVPEGQEQLGPYDLARREVIVAKARMGPTFAFGCVWDPLRQVLIDDAVLEARRERVARRPPREKADSEPDEPPEGEPSK